MENFSSQGGESFEGLDRRICFKGLIKGRDYEEGREFSVRSNELANLLSTIVCSLMTIDFVQMQQFDMLVEYHFIARCYTPKVEEILRAIKSGVRRAPDVIVMNSCLWDLSR